MVNNNWYNHSTNYKVLLSTSSQFTHSKCAMNVVGDQETEMPPTCKERAQQYEVTFDSENGL